MAAQILIDFCSQDNDCCRRKLSDRRSLMTFYFYVPKCDTCLHMNKGCLYDAYVDAYSNPPSAHIETLLDTSPREDGPRERYLCNMDNYFDRRTILDAMYVLKERGPVYMDPAAHYWIITWFASAARDVVSQRTGCLRKGTEEWRFVFRSYLSRYLPSEQRDDVLEIMLLNGFNNINLVSEFYKLASRPLCAGGFTMFFARDMESILTLIRDLNNGMDGLWFRLGGWIRVDPEEVYPGENALHMSFVAEQINNWTSRKIVPYIPELPSGPRLTVPLVSEWDFPASIHDRYPTPRELYDEIHYAFGVPELPGVIVLPGNPISMPMVVSVGPDCLLDLYLCCLMDIFPWDKTNILTWFLMAKPNPSYILGNVVDLYTVIAVANYASLSRVTLKPQTVIAYPRSLREAKDFLATKLPAGLGVEIIFLEDKLLPGEDPLAIKKMLWGRCGH